MCITKNRIVFVSGAATASFAYDADGKQVIGTVQDSPTPVSPPQILRIQGGELFACKEYNIRMQVLCQRRDEMEGVTTGIYWLQQEAEWRGYDGELGRFTQPDSIVPTGTQGTQAWDRYAFVNNNPVRYNDPTGHMIDEGEGGGGRDISGRSTKKVIESKNSKGDGPFTDFDPSTCPGPDCELENLFQLDYQTLTEMELMLLNLQSSLYTFAEILGAGGALALLAAAFFPVAAPGLLIGGTTALLTAGAIAYEASQLTYLIQMVNDMKDAAMDSPSKSISVMTFRSPNVHDSNLSLTYNGANRAYTPNSISSGYFIYQTQDVYTPYAPFILQ